jgi:hypothetical protein
LSSVAKIQPSDCCVTDTGVFRGVLVVNAVLSPLNLADSTR